MRDRAIKSDFLRYAVQTRRRALNWRPSRQLYYRTLISVYAFRVARANDPGVVVGIAIT